MENKGYKTTKRLTNIRNQVLLDGWEKYKADITMEEYFRLLQAMPKSLSHLYLILRDKEKRSNKN